MRPMQVVSTLVLRYFCRSRLGNAIKTSCQTLLTVDPDICSLPIFYKQGLRLVSPPYFVYDFSIKVFIVWSDQISLPNFPKLFWKVAFSLSWTIMWLEKCKGGFTTTIGFWSTFVCIYINDYQKAYILKLNYLLMIRHYFQLITTLMNLQTQ